MDRQSLIEGELLSLCIEDEAFRANVLAKLKPDDFSGNNAKVFRKIALIHGEGKDMSRESIATVTGVDLPNHTDRDYEPIVDAMVERRTDTETMLAIERYYDESIKDSRMARANLLATLSEATADSSTTIRGGGIVDEYEEYLEDTEKLKPVGRLGSFLLDKRIGELRGGRIYTIVAGSGVGKSAIAIQAFEESMMMGTKCLFITTEMSTNQLVERMIARRINISPMDFDKLTVEQLAEAKEAEGEISELMAETGSAVAYNVRTAQDVASMLITESVKNGVQLVILDHLHNLRGDGDIYRRISDGVHDIQAAVIRSGVAFIMLAQMSRSDRRETNIDMVSGKGAGDIEEVSDVLMVVTRNRLDEGQLNDMDINITKNRHGMTGWAPQRIEFPSFVIKPR